MWRTTEAAVVSLGEWHTIELIVNAQSAVGVPDGSFQVFLDDVDITADFTWLSPGSPTPTTMQWYGSGAPTRLFSGVQLFLYWGGSVGTKTVSDHVDLSEFYITGVAVGGGEGGG